MLTIDVSVKMHLQLFVMCCVRRQDTLKTPYDRQHCMRRTATWLKVSLVTTRPAVSMGDLAVTRDYKPPNRVTLAPKYNRVTPEVRYDGLKFLLESLSGHVGRRQIRMQNDMTKFLPHFKREGVDWHDLKAMERDTRLHFLRNRLRMTPSEMLIIQVALERCVCGVLTKGSSLSPETFCKRSGVAEHDWRCGFNGHTTRVYFEEKRRAERPNTAIAGQPAAQQQVMPSSPVSPRVLTAAPVAEEETSAIDLFSDLSSQQPGAGHLRRDQLVHPPTELRRIMADVGESSAGRAGNAIDDSLRLLNKRASALAEANPNQTLIKYHKQNPHLNFLEHGRLRFDNHPRSWSAPLEPTFRVDTMGYDFHIHPLDPRTEPQIVRATRDWALHAKVVRNMLWELIEEHAQLRDEPQPLDIAPEDVPSLRVDTRHLTSIFSTVDPETGITVERRLELRPDGSISAADATSNASGAQGDIRTVPWFSPPPPQDESADGIPRNFPYAPTVAVRSMLRPFPAPAGEPVSGQLRSMRQPLVELSLLVHPKAAAWWPPETRDAVQRHLLDLASRMPYALPWTLYFRVDSSKHLRRDEKFSKQRTRRWSRKVRFFNPARIVVNYEEKLRARQGTPAEEPGDADSLAHLDAMRHASAAAGASGNVTTTHEVDAATLVDRDDDYDDADDVHAGNDATRQQQPVREAGDGQGPRRPVPGEAHAAKEEEDDEEIPGWSGASGWK
jgi:hypothetical protein